MKVNLFKLALQKSYFDKGYGVSNYLKYLIAFFGLASNDVKTTLIIGIAYAIFCYFFGMMLFKIGYVEAEIEIGNRYNTFVKEMRKLYKSKTFI